jgi:hypothetical protein
MLTIPDIVQSLVRKSPFLEEALAAGLVNHSALARLIKKEVEREAQKRVQSGAVVVAVNRLARSVQGKAKRQRSVFRRTPDLIVRLNLFEVTYANSRAFLPKQVKLFERLSARPQFFLTVTRGINETTIIASRELREHILTVCRGETLISQIDQLASVTVMLAPGTALIPGVYSYILKALAWEGLNVVEVVSTLNEFTIVLEDKNVSAAFSIIKALF